MGGGGGVGGGGDFVELNPYISLLLRGISGFWKKKVLNGTAVMCLKALPINAFWCYLFEGIGILLVEYNTTEQTKQTNKETHPKLTFSIGFFFLKVLYLGAKSYN